MCLGTEVNSFPKFDGESWEFSYLFCWFLRHITIWSQIRDFMVLQNHLWLNSYFFNKCLNKTKQTRLGFSDESINFQKHFSLKQDILQLDYPVLPHEKLKSNALDHTILYQKQKIQLFDSWSLGYFFVWVGCF